MKSCLHVRGRAFRSEVPDAVLDRIQLGVLRTVYRNIAFLKSPFDIAIYLQLLSRLRPRTVIEIGTKAGGSALWFADMLSADGVPDARVVSIDINPPPALDDGRIDFLAGEAANLGAALSGSRLRSLSRPWLVIDDSSHRYEDVSAVLSFFAPLLETGDYLVVEDGIVGQLTVPHYRQYDDGPSRAVAEFLEANEGRYDLDTDLCDLFGHNATYNPNAWMRRR